MQCHILDNITYSGDTIYMTLSVVPFIGYSDVGKEITKMLREFYLKYGRSPTGISIGIREFLALVDEVQIATGQPFHFAANNNITLNGLIVRVKERPGVDLEIDAELAVVIAKHHQHQPPSPPQPAV